MSIIVPTEVITCCESDCGISFAVPEWWYRGKSNNHSWFYCPNGHRQHFAAESKLDIARRERDIAKQQIARAEQEAADANRRAARLEKEQKQLKKRAAAGTCPCCQRTFSNMATHMKRQHPEFVADTGAKVVPIRQTK